MKRGSGCDDAHGWTIRENLAVLLVADGAGSRHLSGVGAHVAVAAALKFAEDAHFASLHYDDPVSATRSLVERAIAALSTEAKTLSVSIRDLATTLCVSVITPLGAIVAQVGDGLAVIGLASGEIKTVAVADRSEYANETVFLTSPDALDHLKLFSTGNDDPVRSIALSTDGLRYKLLDNLQTSTPFIPFFRDAWDYARLEDASSASVARFLDRVDDQTGDDKTLVLAVHDFVGVDGPHRQLSERPLPGGAAEETHLPETA